jgi:hypothetical protein
LAWPGLFGPGLAGFLALGRAGTTLLTGHGGYER